jgi:hypothetical protein
MFASALKCKRGSHSGIVSCHFREAKEQRIVRSRLNEPSTIGFFFSETKLSFNLDHECARQLLFCSFLQ